MRQNYKGPTMIHAGKFNDLSIKKMMEKNMKLSGIFEGIQNLISNLLGFVSNKLKRVLGMLGISRKY
jgi:hypothetical protein